MTRTLEFNHTPQLGATPRRNSRRGPSHSPDFARLGQQARTRTRQLRQLSTPTSRSSLSAQEKSVTESLKDNRRALDAVNRYTKRQDLDTAVLSSQKLKNGDVIALVRVAPAQDELVKDSYPSIFVVRLKQGTATDEGISQIAGVLTAQEIGRTPLHTIRCMIDNSGTYLGILQREQQPTVSIFKLLPTGDINRVGSITSRVDSPALCEGNLSLTTRPISNSGQTLVVVRAISPVPRVPNAVLTKVIE